MTEQEEEPGTDEAGRGESGNSEQLFATLHSELRRLAERELRRGGPAATLSATTLLHEAYIDMSGRPGVEFPDRARFMAYAARVMRGLIIDYARSRRAQKRGGAFHITALHTNVAESTPDEAELSGIADALDGLAAVEPELAHVVDLKFFCGFSFAEIAAMRGISERTVQRQWEKARIFLFHALQGMPQGE
jgi:RNA polymerase sigma factor (TIGR02999 family)